MRFTMKTAIASHLLAVTLAAPVGTTHEARDIIDDIGGFVGAPPPSPWAPPPGSEEQPFSKLVRRDIFDDIASLIGAKIPSPWSAPPSYPQMANSITGRMGLRDDPLLAYLSDGADNVAGGFAGAKAALLEKVLSWAAPMFRDKDAEVKDKVGENATYKPASLLTLLQKAEGAAANIYAGFICPDGTKFAKEYVTAAYELANLPEVMNGWPKVFSNTASSGGKTSQVYTSTAGDLLQSPLLDDYLNTGKPGNHSVIIDPLGNFLGIVQESGANNYEQCKFQ